MGLPVWKGKGVRELSPLIDPNVQGQDASNGQLLGPVEVPTVRQLLYLAIA